VRCPRCNSENPPEYRFCGMCGTPLDKAAEGTGRSTEGSVSAERVRKPEPVPPPIQTLSGPSFLGLSQPARGTEDVTYLFEEEQPKRSYGRFILLLFILGIIGGLGYLQYARSGKSWTAPWANQKPTTPAEATQQPPAAAPAQNSAPQQAAANAPANGAAQNTPGNPAQPKETDIAPGATPPAGTTPSQPPTNATAPSTPSQQPPANAPAQSPQPANTETTKNAAPAKAKNEAETAPADKDVAKNDAAADEPDAAEVSAPKPKPARVKPAPVPATNPDDALVANAEKYLYGRGVPQNCDRALVSLRAAADRQNARAQSLLGTMYGTGHCVPRDLPNAYRWFAQASRQQADNMWIQRNLEMIWREMTPQERQLAMQSNR